MGLIISRYLRIIKASAMLARDRGALAMSCALHAALVLWLAGPLASAPADRPVEVVLLPPAESAVYPGLQPLAGGETGAAEGIEAGASLAGGDLQRVAEHLAVLFPFAPPGLALVLFSPPPAAASRLVFETPFARGARPAATTRRRHLDMDAAAIQALVDQSW